MRILAIKSSEWLRGTGKGLLYQPDVKKFCCLGLDAIACGIAKEVINGRATLSQVCLGKIPEAARWQVEEIDEEFTFDSHGIASMTMINDAEDTDDEYKIECLRPLFRSNGIIIHWFPNA